MGEQHLACRGVDGRRVGLETADAQQRLGNLHGEHGWDVTFASGHDSLCIELGQSQTAGVVDSRQQVEAADGEAL